MGELNIRIFCVNFPNIAIKTLAFNYLASLFLPVNIKKLSSLIHRYVGPYSGHSLWPIPKEPSVSCPNYKLLLENNYC